MRRRREQSLLTSPLLIGAMTTLVVLVAVILAYRANVGLPFVPSYNLHVQFRNGEELTKGDDVNMGGALIGLVRSVTATRTAAGTPVASVNLKLYKSVDPLPVDTHFTVRLKGAIGLKYLDVELGRSKQGLRNGATVPASQSGASVDFDQVLDMFTPPTARGVQQSTIGLGESLAGRGYDLNNAIGAFLPLVTALGPVTANLSSSQTNLAGFFRGLESFSSALAPVAQAQAALFDNLDRTFTALAGVAPSLQDTISQTPPTFQATIDQSPTIRPFLTDTASLFAQLRPSVTSLRTSAPVLTQAFRSGVDNLPALAGFDTRLVSLSKTLRDYGQTPTVQQGLTRLTSFSASLQSPLQYLAPVQSSCNYVSLFLANTASTLAEHTSTSGVLEFSPVTPEVAPGTEVSPSHAPYNGKVVNDPILGAAAPLHTDPYPNTDSPGQPAQCAAGYEPFTASKLTLTNPPAKYGAVTQADRPGQVAK